MRSVMRGSTFRSLLVAAALVGGALVQLPAAAAAPAATLPGVTIRWDPDYGVPSSLIRYGGYITGPSALPAEQVARGFLATESALFGLSALDRTGLRVL